ncbi:hypothetical protein PVAP13_2KG200258, partial [Panicum virgatum]
LFSRVREALARLLPARLSFSRDETYVLPQSIDAGRCSPGSQTHSNGRRWILDKHSSRSRSWWCCWWYGGQLQHSDHTRHYFRRSTSPCGSAASHNTKGSKRTKNFDWKEDEVVCSGWLNISKDPINGANQSHSTFWSRVHAFFEEHKQTTTVRTESSIMHRWLTIQSQVNKYCCCYEAIERRNQSGKTIQDKISEASKMCQELDKDNKSFTLIHCWNILKEEDKWKTKRIELAELEKVANKKKQKSRPRDTEGTYNEEDAAKEVAPETEASKRPPGINKAKEALRRGSGGEACMEALKDVVKEGGFRQRKGKGKRGEVPCCTLAREEACVN